MPRHGRGRCVIRRWQRGYRHAACCSPRITATTRRRRFCCRRCAAAGWTAWRRCPRGAPLPLANCGGLCLMCRARRLRRLSRQKASLISMTPAMPTRTMRATACASRRCPRCATVFRRRMRRWHARRRGWARRSRCSRVCWTGFWATRRRCCRGRRSRSGLMRRRAGRCCVAGCSVPGSPHHRRRGCCRLWKRSRAMVRRSCAMARRWWCSIAAICICFRRVNRRRRRRLRRKRSGRAWVICRCARARICSPGATAAGRSIPARRIGRRRGDVMRSR